MNDRERVNSTAIRGLLHAANAVHLHLESRLAELGLSLPKLAALAALREAGDSLLLSQLAERLSCVKSNITQLVDRLESDGFVKRGLDPGDRRARLAVLTTAGRVACDLGTQAQADAEQGLLVGFTHDEARQLKMLVDRLSGEPG
jgi:DNA-binding MarR family transcriptional regulator